MSPIFVVIAIFVVQNSVRLRFFVPPYVF